MSRLRRAGVLGLALLFTAGLGASAFAKPYKNSGFRWYQQPSWYEQQSYWGEPQKKTYHGKKKRGPKVASGGPKPYIAPAAPKTVKFSKGYDKGAIVIDTKGRKLYYVLGSGRAYAYPIAVGKSGFSWTGTKKITAKKDWPDWRPPAEMRQRKPELPELMHGGLNNPLGAKALYLGSSLYRIHGTNNAQSIGTASSSGCFRMHNAHVVHLAGLAKVGTTVYVKHKL